MIRKVNYNKAIELYNEKVVKDFPEEEIPPLVVFEKCIKSGVFECLVFENEGIELGYMVIRKVEGLIFIMVLAVDKSQRGKGLGKIFLNEFKQSVQENLVILLEAENPEIDGINEKERKNREKRIGFYKDLGFKITENFKYILVGVDYKVMYYNLENENIIEPEKIKEYMEKIYSGVLRNSSMLKIEIIK